DGGEFGGDMSFKLVNSKDPCYRGTMFPALKITRAYRDNQAFAYHHFEDKRLQISGRLVAIKKKYAFDTVVIDPVTKLPKRAADGQYIVEPKEVYVALVTPDGKFPQLPNNLVGPPPELFGLEFCFPVEQMKTSAELRCAIAALWAGQFVTLKGDCRGAVPSPD